jgi:hypothetical protein
VVAGPWAVGHPVARAAACRLNPRMTQPDPPPAGADAAKLRLPRRLPKAAATLAPGADLPPPPRFSCSIGTRPSRARRCSRRGRCRRGRQVPCRLAGEALLVNRQGPTQPPVVFQCDFTSVPTVQKVWLTERQGLRRPLAWKGAMPMAASLRRRAGSRRAASANEPTPRFFRKEARREQRPRVMGTSVGLDAWRHTRRRRRR